VGSRGISAVCDTGPLLHLAEIDRLPLMHLFQNLHIPQAVWIEATESGIVSGDQLMRLANIKRHDVGRDDLRLFIQENEIKQLHPGELECLFLCKELAVPLLLTDDLAVRDAAKQLDVTPSGSLGIIVRAYRLGLISLAESEQCLYQLYDASSLFVTRAIIEIAVEQLRERPGQ
jgi:predicted nucleic acid-binding protein